MAAMAGMGLPMPMRSLDWQVEVWASLLATACAAFAFAGVIGEPKRAADLGGRGQHDDRALGGHRGPPVLDQENQRPGHGDAGDDTR